MLCSSLIVCVRVRWSETVVWHHSLFVAPFRQITASSGGGNDSFTNTVCEHTLGHKINLLYGKNQRNLHKRTIWWYRVSGIAKICALLRSYLKWCWFSCLIAFLTKYRNTTWTIVESQILRAFIGEVKILFLLQKIKIKISILCISCHALSPAVNDQIQQMRKHYWFKIVSYRGRRNQLKT